jgi:phosphatidylglycerol:prolipoprotein diacylglycerol transferase
MIQPYVLVFTLSVLLAIIWIAWRAPAKQAAVQIDAGLSALAGGMIGARLAYVAFHLGAFRDQPWRALGFWEGGLSWVGGALGAILGLSAYARLAGRSPWGLADALAVPATIVATGAWAGCLVDGCAYGRRADFGLLTPRSTDMLGFVAPRWPTQPIGVFVSLGAIVLLEWLSRRRPPEGSMACVALALVAASSLGLSFLRGDPVPVWQGLRLEAIGAAAALIVGLAILALRWRRGRPHAEQRPAER